VTDLNPPAEPTAAAPPAEGEHGRKRRQGSGSRDTLESIIIAFVLAFLFRTFTLEAFVIPTGSMAPTLMGWHKEITCSSCGYRFTYGVPDDPALRRERDEGAGKPGCRCPNCGYVQWHKDVKEADNFRGDRILVLKFPFDFAPPRRWDVIVFRYPLAAGTNYIKRLVGLPGETIRLHGGDVYTVEADPDGEPVERILRKPLDKIRAVRQIVFDNNRLPTDPAWRPAGEADPAWRSRWVPEHLAAGAWKAQDGGRAFEGDSPDAETLHRLQYRHWLRVGRSGGEHDIRDSCGYNSFKDYKHDGQNTRPVDDLMVCFDLLLHEKVGELAVEILEARVVGEPNRVEAPRRGEPGKLEVRFDLAADRIRVLHDGHVIFPVDCPRLEVGRPVRIEMANFDSRLNLIVDGTDVLAGGYDYDPRWKEGPGAGEGERRPVSIGVKGARLRVANVVLYRDVHYLLRLRENLSRQTQSVDYPLGHQEYFVLGDNSPRSQDGREWVRRQHDTGAYEPAPTVPAKNLIGKAFVVFWPHGLGPVVPVINTRVVPNFGRMGMIR